MPKLPSLIHTAKELEELLTRPTEALAAAIKKLPGDIMVLGAGHALGWTVALLAKRAVALTGVKKRIVAVDAMPLPLLQVRGIETLQCDLLDPEAVGGLPQTEHVIHVAGHHLVPGTPEPTAWAVRVVMPIHLVAALPEAAWLVVSTGAVYPPVGIRTGGATEALPPTPSGEQAMAALGRERVFEYFAQKGGHKLLHARLSHVVELREGVLAETAARVYRGEPVDVTRGFASVVWLGDACSYLLQSLSLASVPPRLLNIAGREVLSLREAAQFFAHAFGKAAILQGAESEVAPLVNAQALHGLFGYPSVSLERMLEWTAHWVAAEGAAASSAASR